MNMRELSADQAAMLEEEEQALSRVLKSLDEVVHREEISLDIDRELISLRDQLIEARGEDRAMLIAHMTRLSALRQQQAARGGEVTEEEFQSAPYFARIEYREEPDWERFDGEDEELFLRQSARLREVYIGKRSFFSDDGRVSIVDWRSSPVSQLYYCQKEGEEFYEQLGARYVEGTLMTRRSVKIHERKLRRVQGKDGLLTRTSDGTWRVGEELRAALLGGGAGSAPQFKSGGRRVELPEITALIDPEQFKLITHERSGVIIIQGGAGTGKTTIALHRVAYLVYQNPQKFKPSKILILTPGSALKRYIAEVLPSLDVFDVPIYTFGEWALKVVKGCVSSLRKVRLHDDTPLGAQRIKRHSILITYLEKSLALRARSIDLELEKIGGPELLKEWVKRRHLPLIARIKHTLKVHGISTGAKEYLEAFRDSISNPYDLWLDLLTDRTALTRIFEETNQEVYQWELSQLIDTVKEQASSPERYDDLDSEYQRGVDGRRLTSAHLSGALDADDCAIILRIQQLLYGYLGRRKGRFTYEHICVDESQDLSPLALKMLCASVPAKAPVTLAGDTAQRVVFNNGFSTWNELLPVLPKGSRLLPPLLVSYRSTRQIMRLARDILGPLAEQWDIRDAREGAAVTWSRYEEEGEALAELCLALKGLAMREPDATCLVVTRTPQTAARYADGLQRGGVPSLRHVRNQEFSFRSGVDVTDAMQVKGLEYDYVIALDVDAEHYPDREEARHLLHVIVTRAAYQLWVLSVGRIDPSPLLPVSLTQEDED